MAHFKKLPQKKNEGKIIYGDKIVDGIVFLALSDMTYARLYSVAPHSKKYSNAISVLMEKDGLHINVSVKVHFSQSISDIAFKIQEIVRYNIESMTDYHVAAVNVIVKGVFFDAINIKVEETTLADSEEKSEESEATEKLNIENDIETNSNDKENKGDKI